MSAAKVPALMIQGTSSDAGKSLLVAGLGRLFARKNIRIRPFKPQNMSNNAAVTKDGGEIGRAQELQARACRVPPSIHMNPILLKPQSEIGAQIIVQGKMWGIAKAAEYHALKLQLLPYCLDSFKQLAQDADLILVEGAGSAAEINLREGDIANMGFAEAADLPVMMVGDIDKGGVIAQMLGTFSILEKEEKARIKGYLINKFRGDPSLFEEGQRYIDRHSGIPCLGIIPWFADASLLPAEDALGLIRPMRKAKTSIKIAVPILPRIANFDDLDPLRAEADVDVVMIERGQVIPSDVDLILLPGSKSTIADLQALYETGWDIDIISHYRRGGYVLGLCGGYQMLGKEIIDDQGIEGPPARVKGLGLLQVTTRLTDKKTLALSYAIEQKSGLEVEGYEIHLGVTEGQDCARPMLMMGGERKEGAVSTDGRIMGCYLHGIFNNDAYRHDFLHRLKNRSVSDLRYTNLIDDILDRWADHLEKHIDHEAIWKIANAR